MATAVRAVRGSLRGVSEHYRKLEELRRQQREGLEARLRELRELRECSTPTETVDVNDVEALSDNASTAGVGAAVAEITSRTLQGIESALGRLKDGKYGVCADCGGEISVARLRAMPFAERCRDCQELADTEGVILAG